MLRITKQTDYGIMLLTRMAGIPEGSLLSARDASEWSGLSLPMVSKILKSLARGGIVVSHRGVDGGYSLAHLASETSVASVIRALEGPISMVECGAHPGQCDHESSCPVRVNWGRINLVVERALEQVPISEMVDGQPTELLSLVGETNARDNSCKTN
jgi:FeS assembly SUF system regulator